MGKAASRGAQPVLLTANRRLVEHFEVEALKASGSKRIERPPVFTWQDWLSRTWSAERDRRALAGEGSLPLPVGEALRMLLWEQAVRRALADLSLRSAEAEATAPLILAGERRLAEGMARAYALACEYDITPDELTAAVANDSLPEQRLFTAALGHYRQALAERGWIDPAELAARVREALAEGSIPPPAAVELHGFRSLSPTLSQLREVWTRRKTEVVERRPAEKRSANIVRRLADPRSELRAAARWARKRLDADPAAGVAIVVCDLHRRRSEVLAVLDQELAPWRPPGAPRPYAISLGAPLSEWFPVRDALAWLHWLLAPEGLPLPAARACLLSGAWRPSGERSPASREWMQREALPVSVTPADFGLEGLEQETKALHALREPPHRWAERFRALLDALGFPGERPLGSDAFQALERFEETLARFSTLSAVLDRIGAQEALARLEGLCRARLFQPQGPAARLQVLGPLEAVGLSFDFAWIAGLNDGRFPPPREPDPFLPLALQRQREMPGTDPDLDAEHDRLWWRTLLGIAGEVRVSFAEREDDRPLLPSWLIAGVGAETGETPAWPPVWSELRGNAVSTEVEDRRRSPLDRGILIRGGAGRFRDHLECPFRGLALAELDAGRPSDPRPPPDARERGLLIHRIMARLAQEAASSGGVQMPRAGEAPQSAHASASKAPSLQALTALRGAQLQAIVEEEVSRCFADDRVRRGLDGVLQSALAAEITRRIETLLESERRRPQEITILAVEGESLDPAFRPPTTLELGGMSLELRCDRLDRLPDGSLAVIDYKSGQARGPGRDGGLADPQLPLYALLDSTIRAVVYARLDGEGDRPVFSGIAAKQDWFPNDRIGPPKNEVEGWFEKLRGQWRQALEAVAQEIAGGCFPAAPRPGVCRRCELAALCRIGERSERFAMDAVTEGEEP